VRGYDIYAARESRGQVEAQLRRAAAAQFGAVSELMEEVAAQLARQKAFEAEAAEAALRVLEDHGFRARSVCCVRGEENAAQLTAAVRPERDHSTGEALALALGRATGIDFGLPETEPLNGAEGMALLTFAQRPRYRLETGAVQMSSSSSDYCGDSFDCFNDGRGREILVISDGMGTGGRAAVDSALATEIFSCLARGGLGFPQAMRIANQALLLKSCEESLATLDAAGVNLYTGEAEFCKAGGAVSFLRRRGRAARVELSALPAGILRSIRPAGHRTALEDGDILVLVSDGMLCGPDAWLCEALEAWKDGSMQALAEHLAGLAVQMRSGMEGAEARREDDLTVICGKTVRV
jgi:stage II sporulation protein E